ncbi:MAG: site-specific integrase, partial [Muribaculaceae bacterium]|nr:site-specific integrase [Muribaculaceae bacterium]
MTDEFLKYLALELNRSPLTIEAYRRDLEQCALFLGKSFAEATLPDLRSWLASLARSGDSPRTLRRKAQALRSLFRWMRKRGIRPDNPAADIVLAKPDRPLPTVARPDQLERLIADGVPGPDPARSIRDTLIIELLYSCGLRQAELLSLTDADIDTRAGRMRVRGKGRKVRVIPIPP